MKDETQDVDVKDDKELNTKMKLTKMEGMLLWSKFVGFIEPMKSPKQWDWEVDLPACSYQLAPTSSHIGFMDVCKYAEE